LKEKSMIIFDAIKWFGGGIVLGIVLSGIIFQLSY
jgi:hypothetical protein